MPVRMVSRTGGPMLPLLEGALGRQRPRPFLPPNILRVGLTPYSSGRPQCPHGRSGQVLAQSLKAPPQARITSLAMSLFPLERDAFWMHPE